MSPVVAFEHSLTSRALHVSMGTYGYSPRHCRLVEYASDNNVASEHHEEALSLLIKELGDSDARPKFDQSVENKSCNLEFSTYQRSKSLESPVST